jgi:putative tricarboxylic transport membrane protein
MTRRHLLLGATALALTTASFGNASAEQLESVHFLVPGGAGGGWDGTARGVGMVLSGEGLVGQASYENMSGAGGGKAIGYMIETADRQHGTMMVNSTPIIVRSLTKVFPYSYRDLTPIASVIGDYQAIVVRPDSEIKSFDDVLARFRENPRSVKFAGGSVRGDLDHLVPAMAFKAAGEDPRKMAYVPYDAGGKAFAGLLSGETELLSTGLGETIGPHRDGQIRIIAISGPERVEGLDVATLKESGVDVEFANWRGFFGAPGISDELADSYAELLKEMQQTEGWEELRMRNGWSNLYRPRAEFVAFLESQEAEIGTLMRELGFLR